MAGLPPGNRRPEKRVSAEIMTQPSNDQRPAYRATVEYDGTDYAGWQIQTGRPTVQGTLEIALAQVCGETIRVNGAGRTDAGVHARGQVIGFRSAWRHPAADLERAFNAVLPAAVAVRELALAAPGFHPRFSACSRLYRYTVWVGPVRAPLRARFAHHVRQPLDVAAMNAAAAHLVGWHDFATFGVDPEESSGRGNTRREVMQAQWRSTEDEDGAWYRFDIEANAFLRTMVRTVTAALLAVGRGDKKPTNVQEMLLAAERRLAPAAAPACGLCLVQVRY